MIPADQEDFKKEVASELGRSSPGETKEGDSLIASFSSCCMTGIWEMSFISTSKPDLCHVILYGSLSLSYPLARFQPERQVRVGLR